MENTVQNNFRINSFCWINSDQACKDVFIKMLKTEDSNISELCSMYFETFYILHKIGHIIMHKYDEKHHIQEARTEYCANLFAYKYLGFKGEKEYLRILFTVIQNILTINKAYFDFDIDKMNGLFSRYKMDFLTYVAYHFNCFNSCISNKHEFSEVIKCMSKGKLNHINNGVYLQKGLSGTELINECVVTVFELNDDLPVIELNYCSNLNVSNLNLEVW